MQIPTETIRDVIMSLRIVEALEKGNMMAI
jgi:hypothetical protein